MKKKAITSGAEPLFYALELEIWMRAIADPDIHLKKTGINKVTILHFT